MFFKKWYIITSESDKATIEYIQELNNPIIQILYYDFQSEGAKFNFGGARLYGQNVVKSDGYENNPILMLDSDIVLPSNFLDILSNVDIQEETIYGISERRDYYCYNDYLKNTNYSIHSHSKNFQGCFQLYKSSTNKYMSSTNAGECDYKFRDLFSTRVHLNLSVQHLGLDGASWDGRDTTRNKFFLEKHEEHVWKKKIERCVQRVYERTKKMPTSVCVGYYKLYF
jgi:hypothetical protein